MSGVNIYPYLKWCDFHVTIYSTTCLEAHYFHKINIFYDYDGIASSYYGDKLDASNGAYYVKKENDFYGVVNRNDMNKISFLELYSKDHIKIINSVLKKYIL